MSIETDSHTVAPGNLPHQLNSFVGRSREVVEVKRLLKEHRLVTLTGAGGTGKTRLALQVAGDLAEDFPNGIYLIELSSISDPSMVPHTVASVLGVQTSSSEPVLSMLADHLVGKGMLLVLDNCEHVIGSCANLVAKLLKDTDVLRILATSRETLAAAGEKSLPLPPLSVPERRRAITTKQLLEFESVRLFVERARLVNPDFQVTNENVQAVVEICQRLDGIPLAIELAAARMSALSPNELVGRLNDRFRLLTGRGRAVLPRQQTLRALVDWSFDLLTHQEQVTWRRLSVFIGSFTLEAAQAVAADDMLDEWEVMDCLTRLVEKSILLAVPAAGKTRYRMLETLRAYGQEKLSEASELDAVRERWWIYYSLWCQPVRQSYQAERDEAQLVTMVRPEVENLRLALETLVLSQRTEVALQIATVLGTYWFFIGEIGAGREKLGSVLKLPECDRFPNAHCIVLSTAGFLAEVDGVAVDGLPLLEKACEMAESAHLPYYERMISLFYLGQALVSVDTARARTCFLQMLDFCKDKPDDASRAYIFLGYVYALEGDVTAAEECMRHAESLAKRVPGSQVYAMVQVVYSFVCMVAGDWEDARTRATLAAEAYRMTAPRLVNLVEILVWLGFYEERLGNHSGCYASVEEALTTAIDNDLDMEWLPYLSIAILLSEWGEHESAVAIWNFRTETNAETNWMRQKYGELFVSRTKQALGEDGYAAAVQLGKRMRRMELYRYVLKAWRSLDVASEATDSAPEVPGAASKDKGLHALTEREVDVLATLAKGYTNKRVAEELFLTEGTVRTYLSRVYSKLGVSSRTEALLKARELGLIDN